MITNNDKLNHSLIFTQAVALLADTLTTKRGYARIQAHGYKRPDGTSEICIEIGKSY